MMISLRNEVYKLIFDTYSVEPEFPWADAPDACVFRHYDNRKWFAIIMSVRPEVIGLAGSERIDIMNVKIPPDELFELLHQDGLLPAYHMNKKHWITICLDGRVNLKVCARLLETSYQLTKKKR